MNHANTPDFRVPKQLDSKPTVYSHHYFTAFIITRSRQHIQKSWFLTYIRTRKYCWRSSSSKELKQWSIRSILTLKHAIGVLWGIFIKKKKPKKQQKTKKLMRSRILIHQQKCFLFFQALPSLENFVRKIKT